MSALNYFYSFIIRENIVDVYILFKYTNWLSYYNFNFICDYKFYIGNIVVVEVNLIYFGLSNLLWGWVCNRVTLSP